MTTDADKLHQLRDRFREMSGAMAGANIIDARSATAATLCDLLADRFEREDAAVKDPVLDPRLYANIERPPSAVMSPDEAAQLFANHQPKGRWVPLGASPRRAAGTGCGTEGIAHEAEAELRESPIPDGAPERCECCWIDGPTSYRCTLGKHSSHSSHQDADGGLPHVTVRLERDAAVKRAENAEAERDEARGQCHDVRVARNAIFDELRDWKSANEILVKECDTARAEVEASRAEHVALMRISGTLCDAGDIVVDPLPDGVAALLKSREVARAEVERLKAEQPPGVHQYGERVAEILNYKNERDRLRALLKRVSDILASYAGLSTNLREDIAKELGG